MDVKMRIFVVLLGILVIIQVSGCVERELTILTDPSDAVVVLNDEQLGVSPVTVNFNWYGDYDVVLRKDGYETLKTHRELERPWYDKFPFDLFAQVLWPKRIEDSYTWSFTLEEKKAVDHDSLIETAMELKEQADSGVDLLELETK